MSGQEKNSWVFIVESDPAIYKALCRIGKEAGFSAMLFANSREFFLWQESHRPGMSPGESACIVLDAKTLMAGLDWYTNEQVRSIPKICIGIPAEVKPIIEMLTALEGQFIRRPFTTGELQSCVQMAFTRYRAIAKEVHETGQLVEGLAKLSRRENEVFELVAKGHTNQEISDLLGISIKTVKAHRSKVMRKTNSKSIPDLVRNYEKRESLRGKMKHVSSGGAA